MMFADLIWQLDRWLQCDRLTYYGDLRSGVPTDAFTAFEERFGLQLAADFKALYTWRNGQPNVLTESLQASQLGPVYETKCNNELAEYQFLLYPRSSI
jgi:cell wall assembly regulator SMI1